MFSATSLGSTALSARLDPEDTVREVILRLSGRLFGRGRAL